MTGSTISTTLEDEPANGFEAVIERRDISDTKAIIAPNKMLERL